jgi:hypothetical protein
MSNIYTEMSDKAALKLVMPRELRDELQKLAQARAISLSGLIRLALTQYVKSNK